MNLFELFVKIGVDDQATKGIKDVEKTADKASKGGLAKFTKAIGSGIKTAAKIGVGAVTTVTAAAAAMTTAFIKGTSELAQYGDNIDKMSQKMGLSAEAYQEWDFIMQHSGTSMESLKAGMKTLANAVDSGNEAFERLGITQSDIASMNQEELFAKTIEQLQGVEDVTERTYLAGQLLGRGATELGALLNMSAEETEAMRQQVHDLGGVMSDEAVKAAAAYQDSLQNLKTSFAGIKRGLLSEFLPSMVTVMDGLALIFSGNDSGIAKISEGVNQFADKLMEAVPKIFELGEGILSSLATAILDNLPTLTTTATKVILQLFEGIISALPQIAEGAIEIVRSLTQGLSNNLPTIMNSAIELINVLANGILEMLPEIIKLGLDLIIALANGITEAIKEDGFIDTIISVVTQIVETLTDPETLNALIYSALDLILALVEGLLSEESITALVDAAFMIIDAIVDFLYDPENMLKLVNVAVDLVVAIAKGLISAIWKIDESAKEMGEELKTKLKEIDWLQLGKDIMNSIWDGLVDVWNSLVDWFSNEFDWFSGWFNGTTNTGGWTGSWSVIDGSHAGGLSYVPFDGYIAQLHKGERVLTASEAQRYNNGQYYGSRTDVNVTVGIDDSANAMGLARALLPFLKIAEKEVYA